MNALDAAREATERREERAFHLRAMRCSLAGVLASHTIDKARSLSGETSIEHAERWHSRILRTKNLAKLRFTERGVYLANHEFFAWAEDRVRDVCKPSRFAELIALARDCCEHSLDACASSDVSAAMEAIETRGLLRGATLEENMGAWWRSCPQSGTPSCGFDKPVRADCKYCRGTGYVTSRTASSVLDFFAVARLGSDAIDTAASLARNPLLGGEGAQVAWAVVSKNDLRYYHERNEGHRLCELFSALEITGDWRGEPFARKDAEGFELLRRMRECGVHLWRCAPGRVVLMVEKIRSRPIFPWQRKALAR